MEVSGLLFGSSISVLRLFSSVFFSGILARGKNRYVVDGNRFDDDCFSPFFYSNDEGLGALGVL